uniref:DNA repair protein RAD51 homolog 3 n=1 Tax=Culicoides sonorensis TaxID=179676 RepID=A0A336LZJ9_CULSO
MFKDNETLYSLLTKDISGDEKQCINFGCQKLDELLGRPNVYGVQRGIITEFTGFPGSGKTTVCLQLCVDAILNGKKAVFIDTKGGFNVNRFKDILAAQMKLRDSITLTMDEMLSNLFVIHLTETEQFFNFINNAFRHLLIENPTITIVAIDLFPFLLKTIKAEYRDKLRRYRIVHSLVSTLQELAVEFNFAVVLTNDFTTKFNPKTNYSKYVSSLGSHFSTRIGQRILLSKNATENKYYANLEKSQYNRSQSVEFQITNNGIE